MKFFKAKIRSEVFHCHHHCRISIILNLTLTEMNSWLATLGYLADFVHKHINFGITNGLSYHPLVSSTDIEITSVWYMQLPKNLESLAIIEYISKQQKIHSMNWVYWVQMSSIILNTLGVLWVSDSLLL